MDARFFNVFHDAANNSGLAIADSVDINFSGIFEELIYKDGMLLHRSADGLHEFFDCLFVVGNSHGPAAEHIRWPDDNRIADALGRLNGLFLGEDGVVTIENVPTQFSEDFGSFQEQVPGVMYYLGVSNSGKGWVGLPHSPGYVADEASIEVGARAMAAVMLDVLHSSSVRRQSGQS